jgi:hypothetical protein
MAGNTLPKKQNKLAPGDDRIAAQNREEHSSGEYLTKILPVSEMKTSSRLAAARRICLIRELQPTPAR